MTELAGIGDTRCHKCHYCIKLDHMINYCFNVNSEHYGHVIMDFHPVCTNFTKRAEEAMKVK